MRIYFENYPYRSDLIEPYLGKMKILYFGKDQSTRYTDRIGYIFISDEVYSGPIFILPKSFLIKENGNKLNVLGIQGIYPENVIDTEDPDNPLEITGQGSFLPELGLWLFRALDRFRLEHEGESKGEEAELDSQLPEDGARDKDFLSVSIQLMDFLKEHRSLFTQISLINHSGRNKIDWAKTVKGQPYIEDGEPWYLEPAIKEKTINIDDTLLRLFYSVLQYLRDKYRFPIQLGEVPYELMPVSEIQRLLDTGIGSKEMKRIRHHYFRDDLKILWGLLNSFFTYNTTDSEIKKEYLLVRNFQAIFEGMIDSLISNDQGVTELKKQKDGKLVDHIFRYKSLIGSQAEIYYIGDSKYYSDANRPEGVALYKQFTYAKNTIQYHIDKIYLPGKSEGTLHYRDKYTEGYNITPNFFIRSRVTKDDISFDMPSIAMTYWDETKHLEYPRTNKHFEDRIFDRDTLILREFSINLLFVIAAYAGYEEEYWKSEFHHTLRELFIKSIDKEYEFFILTPKDEDINKFHYLYFEWINGKAYTLESDSKTIPEHLLLAFERTDIGKKDKETFLSQKLREYTTGKELIYDLRPITLAELNKI